jgi:hypothetical protein
MKQQYSTPHAWPLCSEHTTIVRRPSRNRRYGFLWFLVGAVLVIGPAAIVRRMAPRRVVAPAQEARGVVLHATSSRMWIDGVRVDAASVAIPCGTHSIRAEAAGPPLFVDVTCRPTGR